MKDYKQDIQSSEVVLVEFYASWCPHCQRMMPIVAEVKELLQGKVNVFQFDIDKNSALANAESVESIPTFIVYRGGQEVWRNTGEMTGDALLKAVQQVETAAV